MENNKISHAGHRKRLKEKARKYGLQSFADHEVLEYLLTYAIPRKNTNDIAHALLDKFDNILNILNAKPHELECIKGIGHEASLFLSSLGQLYDLVREDKDNCVMLKCVGDCVAYFRRHYQVTYTENFYILCLNSTGRLIKTEIISGTCTDLAISKQFFSKTIVNEDIGSCIIIHTHPNGKVEPSAEDITATEIMMNICALLGVVLQDHIIFNEKEHKSLGNGGYLDALRQKYYSPFNKAEGKADLRQHSNYNYKA